MNKVQNEDHKRYIKDAFDNMLEGCQIINKDWRYLYINDSVAKQAKRKKEELIGRTMMEMYPGIEKTEMFNRLERCMKEGVSCHMENEFEFPDKSKGWFELRIEPIPEGVFILSLDVTEREKAQRELRELNAKLESQVNLRTTQLRDEKNKIEIVLESIGDGVVVIDREWNIRLFNKAASDISGWSKGEAIGRSFREILRFVNEQSREENISFIEEAMLFGKNNYMQEDTVLIKKDQSEIPIGDSVAPIFDINKKVIGAVIIFRDISKEKENNRMRSDFAYASHQLRTPVTKAIWSMEIALEAENNIKKIQECVSTAYLSLQSVQKLVKELLEVSELDQHTIYINRESVNLIDLIKEVVSNLQSKAGKEDPNISLSSSFAEPLSINTDPRFLKRILFEILDNAIKYSHPKGEVRVYVFGQGNNIIIEIKDTGIGIGDEQKPLIFTKFFRGSNFDTTKIAGAGLGLYISREYIRLLNGKIWFKSQDNTTTFSISLPAQ